MAESSLLHDVLEVHVISSSAVLFTLPRQGTSKAASTWDLHNLLLVFYYVGIERMALSFAFHSIVFRCSPIDTSCVSI